MALFVNGVGRLVKKPELSSYGENSFMAKFILAFDNNDKDRTTTFVNCVHFGKRAECLEKKCDKGTKIFITGKETYLPYTDKDGVQKYALNIYVQDFDFISDYGVNQNSQNSDNRDEQNPFEQQPQAQQTETYSTTIKVSEEDLSKLFDN